MSDVSRGNLAGRDFQLYAIPFDAGSLGCKGSQIFQGATGAFGSEILDIITHAHKDDHNGRRHPFSHNQRGNNANGHQRVRDDLPISAWRG